MKTTLIFLASLAVVLGIFAYFAVFGPPTGSYSVSPNSTSTDTSSPFVFASSTASSTAGTVSGGTASSTGGAGGTGAGGSGASTPTAFGTSFATPPLSWPQGQSKISIKAVTIEGDAMTFTLTVQTGGAPECVPLNLRLVADEQGDLAPPNPVSFSFPDSGNCNGAPNQTYTNQTTTFAIDPTALPLLFTTGGSSNIFFEVATTTGNGLSIDFPGTSG